MITDLTYELFKEKVLKDQKPAVIKVYTETCRNCQIFAPVFEDCANGNKDKYSYYELDARKIPEIAKRYKILGVPSLLFFSHGKLVDKKTGLLNCSDIKKKLEPLSEYSEEKAINKELKGFFKLTFR